MENEVKKGTAREAIIEVTAVEIPFGGESSLPVPTLNYVVKAVMTIDEVKRQWQEYQRMEREVLQDDDYVWFVSWKSGGKSSNAAFATKSEAEAHVEILRKSYTPSIEGTLTSRKKKSAFRKMQRFFGLSLPSRESLSDVEIKPLGSDHFIKIEKSKAVTMITYLDKNMRTVRTDTTIIVTAPSGASMEGVGTCSTSERGFKNPDHDISSTSFTRALNRAISDLIGWGEVSAEEIEAPEIIGSDFQHTTHTGGSNTKQTTVVPITKETKETKETGKEPTTKLKSLAELFTALNDKGWQVSELMEVVGDLSNIQDFDAAFKQFSEFKGSVK